MTTHVRNTGQTSWPTPTDAWSAIPTHCSIRDGTDLVAVRPFQLLDESGDPITAAPDETKNPRINAGQFHLQFPDGELRQSEVQEMVEAQWNGRTVSVRLHSAAPNAAGSGNELTNAGGYADLQLTGFNVTAN